jgi:CBS domain containing-hemolysin-like protein
VIEILPALLIVALIALNVFFVAAEYALLADFGLLISGIQLGITAARLRTIVIAGT